MKSLPGVEKGSLWGESNYMYKETKINMNYNTCYYCDLKCITSGITIPLTTSTINVNPLTMIP